MPLTEQASIFAIGVITLGAGIWLLLHLRDVARLFRDDPDIAVGPGRKAASRSTVWFVLIVFNVGWIGALVFWSIVISG